MKSLWRSILMAGVLICGITSSSLGSKAEAATSSNYQTFIVWYPSSGILVPFYLGVTSVISFTDYTNQTSGTVEIDYESHSYVEQNTCNLPFSVTLRAGAIDFYGYGGTYLFSDNPTDFVPGIIPECSTDDARGANVYHVIDMSDYAVGRGLWFSSQTTPEYVNLSVTNGNW